MGALDALPGAADMEILPEQICAERSLMPWCQVHQPKPCLHLLTSDFCNLVACKSTAFDMPSWK